MPVEYFLRYKGQLYDVGTKIRFAARCGLVYEGTITKFVGTWILVELVQGWTYDISQYRDMDKVILEIIEPVYYTGPVPQPHNPNINPPQYNDLFIGTVWYIVIMIAGLFFNDRWLIWIFASIYFFLWQIGIIGGNK
jgi:hypothetical protein